MARESWIHPAYISFPVTNTSLDAYTIEFGIKVYSAGVPQPVNTAIEYGTLLFHNCGFPSDHPAYMDKEHCPACKEMKND